MEFGIIPYSFLYQGGFPPGLSEELPEIASVVERRLMPKSGSLVSLIVQSTSALMAGSVVARPTIDGIAVPLDLDVLLEQGESSGFNSIIPSVPGFSFSAGQRIGVLLESSNDFECPGDLLVTLFAFLQ